MMTFLLFVILIWFCLLLLLRSRPIRDPFIISHRGAAALAPENTIAGIEEAIKHGAQSIEVDVQRTADEVLIVMHDTAVNRTTSGEGEIRELNWDEIKELDAGSHFSPDFANEPVPTLDSVLELVTKESVTLVLEAKDPAIYPRLETQIAETLKRFDLDNKIIVISFDHTWLKDFHKLAPEIPLGSLSIWASRAQQSPGIELVDVHWLSVFFDPTQIRRLHQRGYTVVVWTVNNVWLMKLLRWLGVDGITTDYPNRGSAVLN